MSCRQFVSVYLCVIYNINNQAPSTSTSSLTKQSTASTVNLINNFLTKSIPLKICGEVAYLEIMKKRGRCYNNLINELLADIFQWKYAEKQLIWGLFKKEEVLDRNNLSLKVKAPRKLCRSIALKKGEIKRCPHILLGHRIYTSS